MLEVVFAKERPVLHALLVKHISTYGILAQNTCSPLPELSSTEAVHAVTNCDDGIETIEKEVTTDIPISFATNYRDFLGSCLLLEFITIIDVLQMQTNIVRRAVEQRRHCLLRCPDVFILVIYLHALFLPFRLENQELRRAVSYLSLLCHILITFLSMPLLLRVNADSHCRYVIALHVNFKNESGELSPVIFLNDYPVSCTCIALSNQYAHLLQGCEFTF